MDGAAWTDLVTNTTTLQGLGVFDLLGPEPGFPRSALSSFIHEGVHHWCFHSVVGAALSLLRVRARSNVMASLGQDDIEAEKLAVEDLVRFELARTLLRPLAEGLAVFAEQDVAPGPAPVASQPMRWTYFCFAPPGQEELETSWGYSLAALLQDLRLDRDNVRRKASLLVGPLDCDEGGYLAGYLTVKTLWIMSTEKDSRLWDTDLFYSFLRRYIYEDYGFVEVLLDTRRAGPEAGEAIAEYLQVRLAKFTSIDFATELDAFIQSNLGIASRPLEHVSDLSYDRGYESIGTDARRHEAGRRALAQGVAALGGTVTPIAAAALAQRQLMRLCSEPVVLHQDPSGTARAMSGDQTLLEVPAIAEFADGVSGSLDVYLSMGDGYMVVSASADGRLVALDVRGDPPPEIGEQLKFYALERVREDALDEAYDKGLVAFVAVKFGEKYEALRREFMVATSEIYARRSVWIWIAPERRELARSAMRREGFFKLVDSDLPLVEMLAALSIAGTMRLNRAEAVEVFPDLAGRIDGALEQFLRSEEEFGYPLVIDRRVHLTSYV